MERKLAAILAADVVGYSRLMEQDEFETLSTLKAWRMEILEPLVTQHRGRIFKLTGDGVLIEFGSAVNAVQCAIDLQHGMAAANANLPEARRMVLRIGVNLGDVIVEDSDLYGDGVNIAARLEGIADPGGIAISGTAFDHVRNKIKAGIEELGIQTLKNIAEPVRVYRIIDTPRVAIPASKGAPDKPSIAVLPFTNMSGDPDQEYFSDGITEDILTELSRFRILSTIARDSSFRFRTGNIDAIRIGRELGAQYLLEGSVRKMGDKIRITAQLIDATTGNHVWAERFDRAQDEIFTVQDQVVRTIVATMAGRLQAARVDQSLRKPPASLAAYDCVLRANALPVSDREAQVEARRLSERAIELDPNYGRAYTQLAISYYLEWSAYDWNDSTECLDKAFALANKAVMLDENDSNAYTNLGLIHMRRRSYDLAEHCCRKAMALNPNSPICIAALGILYGYLGKTDEAVTYLQQARVIDPFFEPTWYWYRFGFIDFVAGRYRDAISHLLRSPTSPHWLHGYLAACYALLGSKEQAQHHAAEALRMAPQFTIAVFMAKEPLKRSADQDRLREGLRKAGLPE